MAYGWGHKSIYVQPDHVVKAFKASFALQTIWIVSLALVRISLACSLLRFGTGWWWRGGLWTLIFVQSVISLGWFIIQFAQCRPLRIMWGEMVPPEQIKCWDRNVIINYGWASACKFFATSFVKMWDGLLTSH